MTTSPTVTAEQIMRRLRNVAAGQPLRAGGPLTGAWIAIEPSDPPYIVGTVYDHNEVALCQFHAVVVLGPPPAREA